MPLDLDQRVTLNVEAISIDARVPHAAHVVWRGQPRVRGCKFSAIMISNTSFTADSIQVIDGLWITTGAVAPAVFRIGYYPTIETGVAQLCRYSELANDGLGGPRGPAQVKTAAYVGLQMADATSDIIVTVPINSTLYVPVEATVVPGSTAISYYGVEAGTVNINFYVYFTGRTFAPAQQQR